MILAYIDPGTGSMLFTIVTGFAIALYFVVKSAWIRFKTIFAGRGKSISATGDRKERIVIYSEGARYWNTFLPIVKELERRGIQAAYLSSEEGDPAFSQSLSFVGPRYIGSGNLAYARLNALEAEVCLMTTPGLDVYQLKRSKKVKHYAHILHSVDDATFYRLFGLDYFDSVLLTGEYQAAAIRELEAKRGLKAKELPVVGCTYLDVYAAEAKAYIGASSGREKKGTTVLVSPSWGDSGILKRYGESLLLPLAESGFRVIIRPHPQSLISEADVVERLKSAMASYPRVEWNFDRENLGALSAADLMISDSSGVVFDYAFLFGRPVLYAKQDFDLRPYDASDSSSPIWKFATFAEIGKELKPADFPRIAQVIGSVKTDPTIGAAIAAARDEAWQYRGQSGARALDFLLTHVGGV